MSPAADAASGIAILSTAERRREVGARNLWPTADNLDAFLLGRLPRPETGLHLDTVCAVPSKLAGYPGVHRLKGCASVRIYMDCGLLLWLLLPDPKLWCRARDSGSISRRMSASCWAG